jgi:hypothetical protein
MPARDYYLSLLEKKRAKVNALFGRFAEQGVIHNREKFRRLGHKAAGKGAQLWEFKSFQDRFLGDFRPGKRFLIAHALCKKGDNLSQSDIERAVRILEENDLRERKGLS